MTLSRLVDSLARGRAAGPARRLANRLLGGRPRVVRVRSGLARGLRLELDLRTEKAYWLGHYEPALQDALRAHVRPGAVVYDVGAHVGFVALCAAALGAEVYAFEPFSPSARRLRRNVALNGLPVEVVEAAAWDEDGEIELERRTFAQSTRTVPGQGVRAVTLDAFALTHPAPDLVKLDVEGAEGRVLRGAGRLLRELRPAVVCEVHGPEAEAELAALLDDYDLSPLGGRWRVLALPRD